GTTRLGVHRHFSTGLRVGYQHFGVVHPVELITRQDEGMVDGIASEIANVLPHRIGRSLIPIGPIIAGEGLLSSQNLDKSPAKGIEPISSTNVAMETHRQELRENIAAIDAAIDAVRDRNIDQPVLPPQGYGRLRPMLGEGLQSRPSPS